MNYRVLKAEEIYKNDLPELKIEQYLVKKEDTLYSLAKKYKTTVGELLKLNPEIKDGQTIKINQKYLVPILKEKLDEGIQENKKNKTKQIKIIEDRQIKKIIEKIN
ncbi:MAG: LysM peptidoglycan-binding domain-containing protein [Fusobacterium sp.]